MYDLGERNRYAATLGRANLYTEALCIGHRYTADVAFLKKYEVGCRNALPRRS